MRDREDWSLLGACERTHHRPRYRTPNCYRTTIYDRGTIRADPTPDMDIRNPFSRLKKKVKHLGRKQKPGKTGTGADANSVTPDNLPPQSEAHVVADDGEGNGAGEGGQKTGPTDQPPQWDEPEQVPANGGEDDQGGGEADLDGGEISPMYSHAHPDVRVEVGAGGGPCRDGNGADGEDGGQFHSSSYLASIPPGGEPDGALTSPHPHHSLRHCGHCCS